MKQKASKKRGGNYDNCSTPGYAIDPIEAFIPLTDVIWEPAYGEGYLANELKKRGYNVWVSSLEAGQDFFTYEPKLIDYTSVTNPPFSLKYEWIERCYDLGKPWFLLLPVETIGAGKAQKMFSKHGVNVIWLSKRINFKMPYKGWQGTAQFPTAWFWWRPDVVGRMDFYNYDYLTREVRESYEY
jgi:hypothetical protein